MLSTFRDVLGNRFIGDDRCPAGEKPPVLRRRSVYALAVFVVVGISYGTLMPFCGGSVGHPLTRRWVLEWVLPDREDFFTNFLLYVPLGICIRLMIRRRDRSEWLQVPATVLLACSLSFLTEYLQSFVPLRVSSLYDVSFNVAGAFVGALFAPRFQTVYRNVHALFFFGIRHRPFAALAWLVGILLTISLLAPFDLRLSRTSLAVGLNSAEFTPWPSQYFGDPEVVESPADRYKCLFNDIGAAGGFLAFGFVLVLAFRERGRSVGGCMFWGSVVVAAVSVFCECCQIVMVSHQFDAWDLVVAWTSGWAGARLAVRLQARSQLAGRPAASGEVVCPIWAAWGALVFQTAYVLGAGLAPFEFGPKGGDAEAWILIPFAGEFQRARNGIPGDCVLEFLRYFVMGLMIVFFLESHSHNVRGWHVAGLVLCLVSFCEVFQIYLADRYADTTTPILALAGSCWAWFAYCSVVYDLENCSVVVQRLGRPARNLIEQFAALRAARAPGMAAG